MSTARKLAIVRKAGPVSEIASEIAASLEDVAAALCFDAATKYEGTAGEQQQIAGLMFRIAQLRFGGINYDGQPINHATIEEATRMWNKLMSGRAKRK